MRKIKENTKELINICQRREKPYEMEIYGRYLQISIFFTRFALLLGISANSITFLNLLFMVISCFLVTNKNPLFFLFGLLFYHIFTLIDCVDGEVARYNKSSSLKGQYFDEMLGEIYPPFLFGFSMIGIFLASKNQFILPAGLFLSLSTLIRSISMMIWNNILQQNVNMDTSPRRNTHFFPVIRYLLRGISKIHFLFTNRGIINVLIIATLFDMICPYRVKLLSYVLTLRETLFLFYGFLSLISTFYIVSYPLFTGNSLFKNGSLRITFLTSESGKK